MHTFSTEEIRSGVTNELRFFFLWMVHNVFLFVPSLPGRSLPSFCHNLTSRLLSVVDALCVPVPDWKLLGITYGSPG